MPASGFKALPSTCTCRCTLYITISIAMSDEYSNAQRVLGICGLAGSGKDTLADYLVKNHGYTKLSFAAAIKDVVAAAFGWDRHLLEGSTPESRAWRDRPDAFWSEQLSIANFTPRLALQRVGTECFRDCLHPGIWIAALQRRVQAIAPRPVVITDCRFPNEVELISHKLAGRMILVRRKECEERHGDWFDDLVAGRIDEVDVSNLRPGLHASEYAWVRGTRFAHVVCNDGPLDHLEAEARRIARRSSSSH